MALMYGVPGMPLPMPMPLATSPGGTLASPASGTGGDNSGFIQEVIQFIDQPLSPTSLNKLKKSCKAQPGYREKSAERHSLSMQQGSPYQNQPVSPAQPAQGGGGMVESYPVGTEIEAQHLHNTTEFNGLRGVVIGHQDDKVLVEFTGGNGQVFDIPPPNLKVVNLPAGTPSAAAPSPAGLTPPTYTSPMATEALTLQAKLKCALSHVEAAKEAMIIATQLHILDPELLYNTVSEFQPTLSRANVAKNWAKVVQIYQLHAERVERGISPGQDTYGQSMAGLGGGFPAPVAPPTMSGAAGGVGEEDLTHSLEGVINFIDAPLSPRTLREVRTIRHSLSPKRDRPTTSASPLPQQSAYQAPQSSPYQPSPLYNPGQYQY